MSHPSTARLFIALEAPPWLREELALWASAAARAAGASPAGGGMRLLESETMHLTVCFLGERPVEEVEPLCELVQAVSQPPMSEVALGAPLWLPRRRPRALAVEVHDDERSITRLYDALIDALARPSSTGLGEIAARAQAGAPRRRPFKPHITVARLRPRTPLRRRELPPTPARVFVPERLTLYRSWLRPDGAAYDALASASTDGSNNCSVRGGR